MLNALREVEDALVAYRTDRAARDELAQTVDSAQRTLALARDRYVHGVADFIQVLNAESTLTEARQSLVQADMTLTNDGRMTNVRKPVRSKDGAYYTIKTADGKTYTIPASRVVSIVPHGDTKSEFRN